jgi:hypothetical protein
MKSLATALLSIAFASIPLAVCAQQTEPCKGASYQDGNQVDYGPLSVQAVGGRVADFQQVPIPKACVALFTESGHKLLTAVETDGEGNFSLPDVKPGRYRLVVMYEPLCPANAKLQVVRRAKSRIRLHAHMKPRGIDDFSYVDIGSDR